MGAQRARFVVTVQAALMRAAGEFGEEAGIAELKSRALASAAALDYVLMLASGSAGTRIPRRDAERAIAEGCTRAVEDLLACGAAIAALGTPAALEFAHTTAHALHAFADEGSLASDDRRFALIALANA